MATTTLTAAATVALQELGVFDPGESPSAQQLADALNAANRLLDNWSSEQLFIPLLLRAVQNLTQNTQAYSIGTGSTWNMARPVAIIGASLINPSGPGNPIQVVDERKWTSLPDRQSLSWQVAALYYDRGFPNGNCYVAPLPQGPGLSVELITWSPLTQFADVNAPITLFPGYLRAIQLALAVELAPQYSMSPSPGLLQNYSDALARIRNLNAELVGAEPPSGQISAASGGQVPPNQGAQ